MEKIPLTRAGYDALDAELKQLKSVERPTVIKAIAEAREHGDLSENAEYHAAREKQSFIEGRIKEVEGLIGRAEVIDPTTFDPRRITAERLFFSSSAFCCAALSDWTASNVSLLA